MIRVAELSARVPGFVLDRASFTVPTGGVGVLTGPTGAGKTTLLETIAGVREQHAGTITLGDLDATTLPPERRHIGLVYQQAWLFPHLSVRANVAYGALRDRLVDDVLSMLHIGPLIEKPVSMLSGGERQLVALARALACDPRTLLLDEPFAAMDSALRSDIRSTVLSWAAARGATTMLVTHDASEAVLVGSVQLRMHAGVLTVVA